MGVNAMWAVVHWIIWDGKVSNSQDIVASVLSPGEYLENDCSKHWRIAFTLVENNWMVWLSRVKIISSDKHWAQDEMFFNSSVFVKTWYWSWIWLVFVLGLKCASHLHKCCPNHECLCSYLTPIKRPDSALHPCQSSLRYNCLHVWLSTIQTWIEFARFS